MLLKSLFGAILFLSCSFAVLAEEGTGPQVGQPIPNLIGRTLNDEPYMLKKDKGSPKVINFFWVRRMSLPQSSPVLLNHCRRLPPISY